MSDRPNYWETAYWTATVKPVIFQRLWDYQRGRCSYCLCEMRRVEGTPRKKIDATIDHVIPVSKGGGRWDIWNIVLACNFCNGRKGDSIWKPRIPIGYGEGIFDGLEDLIYGFDMMAD